MIVKAIFKAKSDLDIKVESLEESKIVRERDEEDEERARERKRRE